MENDGVFGEKAHADDRTDGEPPARIFGFEKADGEPSDEHPPQDFERCVLKLRGLKDGQRRERYCECRCELSETAAAEVARHEAADDDDYCLREDGEEAETGEREAEEGEADVLDERRERGIGDEAPVEMARVGEELQFVAMEAVLAIGEEVAEGGDEGDGEHR